MILKTSLTGSFPPIHDPDDFLTLEKLTPEEIERDVLLGIDRAIYDQIEMGIDYLVDGQVRDDIVSLFTGKIPGYQKGKLGNVITEKIHPANEPLEIRDYLYAKKKAGDRPLKAQLTGPLTLARSSMISSDSPYSQNDLMQIVQDLAAVLGQEANFLSEAGAEVIQIDEPILRSAKDLDCIFEAIHTIHDMGKISTTVLHICGNITNILPDVIKYAPVEVISLEGSYLLDEKLREFDGDMLVGANKKLAIGCIDVLSYKIDPITKIQNFLDKMIHRFGTVNIWAVTPNCGLRTMPYEVAKEKIKVMVEAVKDLY